MALHSAIWQCIDVETLRDQEASGKQCMQNLPPPGFGIILSTLSFDWQHFQCFNKQGPGLSDMPCHGGENLCAGTQIEPCLSHHQPYRLSGLR